MISREILRSIVSTGLLSVCSLSVIAQEPADSADGIATGSNLTLFEAVETAESRVNSPARPTRESRVTTSEPEFTLIGTSRIGGNYSALVRHKSGETVIVKTNGSGNTAIADYDGYALVNVAAGAVSIRYPANNPCMDFSERGVRCNDAANIAELSLTNGEPLAARTNAISDAAQLNAAAASENDVENGQSNPANPFEALRNGRTAAAGQDGNPDTPRFTPRRINPEDVPEGMRIIATPFGDRLVEQ